MIPFLSRRPRLNRAAASAFFARWFDRLSHRQQAAVCLALVAVNTVLYGVLGWQVATPPWPLWSFSPGGSAALFAGLYALHAGWMFCQAIRKTRENTL